MADHQPEGCGRVAAPLYQRIAAQLRSRITSGQLKPGDKLPPEPKLVEEFGVSRDTVRDATALLVHEGLVERVPGRGGGMVVRDRLIVTFHASYAERPGEPYPEADAWHSDVRAQGLAPSQEFEARLVTLTDQQAALLRLDGPEPAVLRRCIRYVNNRPSSVQDSFYPRWLTTTVPELMSPQDIAQGTTRLLAERGFVQRGYLDTVGARMATPEESALLGLGSGTPVLVKTRVACTAEHVVRLTVEVMTGDGNEVEYEIGDISVIRGGDEP
jgi:GntR family transcriptional regulator